MIAVWACQSSGITGTIAYSLTGSVGNFQGLVAALQNEQGESPMPTQWDDVGYTAWTTEDGTFDGTPTAVEVGRGSVLDSAPDFVTRFDANVSFSTNSNNRVSWPGGETIYVAITLNNYDLEN